MVLNGEKCLWNSICCVSLGIEIGVSSPPPKTAVQQLVPFRIGLIHNDVESAKLYREQSYNLGDVAGLLGHEGCLAARAHVRVSVRSVGVEPDDAAAAHHVQVGADLVVTHH